MFFPQIRIAQKVSALGHEGKGSHTQSLTVAHNKGREAFVVCKLSPNRGITKVGKKL